MKCNVDKVENTEKKNKLYELQDNLNVEIANLDISIRTFKYEKAYKLQTEINNVKKSKSKKVNEKGKKSEIEKVNEKLS